MEHPDRPDAVIRILFDERTEEIYQAEAEKNGQGKTGRHKDGKEFGESR